MIKKCLGIAFSLTLLSLFGRAELSSLSHLFSLGKTIQDIDGDGHGEKIALSIIIADNPSAGEIALAADIAARANLESLAQDFGLVRRESEVEDWSSLPNPILIGSNLRWSKDLAKERKVDLAQLGADQGLVFVFSRKNQRGIACFAGSDEALLRTGRAFFLRWPYFWEVWGREDGATYQSFESDLKKFLGQEEIGLQTTVIREALYEFPPSASAVGALKNLSFTAGEIKNLVVDIYFTDESDQKKAYRALDLLRKQRLKGQRSAVLSYPACAQISFELRYGKKSLQSALPRLGSTARLLTPSFKKSLRVDGSERGYDLVNLFSTSGFYADRDQDGILDGLETSMVIPGNMNGGTGIAQLASKLVLPTAGASFPIVYQDSEIISAKSLLAPILIGPNRLTQDLIKSGKFRVPNLEPSWGLVQVVPKAFNQSNALVLWSPETSGLEKTLNFMAMTFPYLDDSKEGNPQLRDVLSDFKAFLNGEKGSAEVYFYGRLQQLTEELKDKVLESVEIRLKLPRENKPFEETIRKGLEEKLKVGSLNVVTQSLRKGQTVFEKEKDLGWEGDEALTLLEGKISELRITGLINVSLGVSESPEVRQKLKKRAEQVLAKNGLNGSQVEVFSAYKQGFFWLTEKVLPSLKNKGVHHITIRFSENSEPRTALKRFYNEPCRWLQELYPSDEILAKELLLPLERIEFEIKPAGGPVYEVLAFDDKNGLISQQAFSPRTKEIPFINVLPEWGRVNITTGWLRLESAKTILYDAPLQTDLEKFWDFYQEEVLRPVTNHILKKTEGEPTFAKQPFFKRLLVELWASEPDYKLGLDEEIVSSLEAIHDEIYFDTLDFLRGITRLDEDARARDSADDPSRLSAPGNVLPMIHSLTEGGTERVKILFEDWPALTPEMEVRWKEKGLDEVTRKLSFPSLKAKSLEIPGFLYNGQEGRMEILNLEMEAGQESDYLTALDIMESYRNLMEKGLIADPFNYPKLKSLVLRLKWQNLDKEEILPVAFNAPEEKPAPSPIRPDESVVPTDIVLSPEKCLDIVNRLSQFRVLRAYTGGRSYEGRPVPVLEAYLPFGKYVSTARLITFKPTLQLSGRQHANEISSTNYALKLAELLAREKTYQDGLRKINFVIQPMENPDGAALAYELSKQAPFHSLHAGRYGSLGLDIGSQEDSSTPLLPEAVVRSELYKKWEPDITLNLHGYPSHEWVQQFSSYPPYLFRDYWIPRGWFTYFKTLRLPIYEKWKEAGEELKSLIVQEMQTDERIKEFNKRLQDRYNRWAARWQPQLSQLEIADGVNIYAKRLSPQENRMTLRNELTFAQQTPEVMDEPASGAYLNFLCEQGLIYLRAHLKYLSQVKFEISRIEEEVQDRVRIEFHRSRPGQLGKPK